MAEFQLAQLNIARLLAPMDSPQLAGFVDNLDRINALADGAPGFVWRLQDEAGNATAIRPFGDEYLVNISVWRDIESLYNFVYKTAHTEVMRRRKEWFGKMADAYTVLWWVPAGHQPTEVEARQRLELLREKGPSPQAFTFKDHMEPVSQLKLDGRIVRLEPLLASHHDDLLRAAADGELWHSKVTTVPTRDTMAAYIARALDEQAKGKQMPFVIVHKERGVVVGTTRYMNIDVSNRRREIGSTWISASVQRTAVNTEAKYLLLRQAFEGYGCIRVEFFTDFLNEQSRMAILRLGAQYEGMLRSHMIMPNGRIRNSVCYSIIESEWPAVRDRLLKWLNQVTA